MEKLLRALMVEDREDDAFLIGEYLKKGGYEVLSERVETEEAMQDALAGTSWDVILCDYSMPRFDVTNALRVVKESGLDLPFIVVSGQMGEEAAVACMKQGAHDYMMKDNLARLVPAVERELREAVSRREKKKVEEENLALLEAVQKEKYRLSTLIENIPDEIWFADKQKIFTLANPAALKQFCLERDLPIEVERLAESLIVLRPDGSSRPMEEAPPLRALAGEVVMNLEEIIQIPASGEFRYRQVNAMPVRDPSGSIVGSVSVVRDITEHKMMEKALAESEAKYRNIFENAMEGIYQSTPAGRFIMVNSAMARMAGYDSPEDLIESIQNIGTQFYVHSEDRKRLIEIVAEKSIVKGLEIEFYKKDGARFWGVFSARVVKDAEGEISYFEGIIEDITERKHMEEQLRHTVDSLRKAFGAIIQVMVAAVESRDPYTAGHQIRSADLARTMAREMGLSPERIDGIRMAGSIHDIGKLSIPAEILSKPTKLTVIEFSLIKEHALKGFEMLKDVESPWPLAEIVYQHHERVDGSGYPRQLKGEEILLEARILAVADVVEAMASHRPYRPALGLDAALAEIENNKGTLYDAAAVDACLILFREKGYKLEGARL